MKLTEIKVPAGIGDGLWVAMKLSPKKKYSVTICGGKPYRAHQFWELLPFVKQWKYDDMQKYPQDCTHEMNRHLEAGRRIDEEGETNWQLPLLKPDAVAPFQIEEGWQYVGIYESSKGHAWRRQQPTWDGVRWIEVMKAINSNLGGRAKFVIFGAEYDDYIDGFIHKIPNSAIDCRRAELPATIAGIMQCRAFVGFPSGIPILANYLGIPTIMPCHSQRHALLQNTFCRKEYIGTNMWKAGDWGGYPKGHRQWLDWIKQNKWPL